MSNRGIDRGASTQNRQRRGFQGIDGKIFRRRVFMLGVGDLVGGGTTLTQTMFKLMPREVLIASAIIPRVKWSGGGITSLTMAVGITGNTGKYQTAYDTCVEPGDAVYQFTAGPWMETVDEPKDVLLTCVGNVAVSLATGGMVTVECLIAP